MLQRTLTALAATMLVAGTAAAQGKTKSASGVVVKNKETGTREWYRAKNGTCATTDIGAAHEVMIKSDKFDPKTMISPDSAKLIALCVVPGQIGSGEMNVTDGRTAYAITIIPNGKKTHSKVTVDARTGAVLSEKQFGGMRGLAGWVRESFEHEQNKTP